MLYDITFQSRFTINQCRHNVSALHIFAVFQNNNVSIDNVRVDHRIPTNTQGKSASIFRSVGRTRVEGDMSFNRLLCQCCHSGRNLAVNRNVSDSDLLYRRDERSRLTCVSIKNPFSLQHAEVLHDRGLTGEAEMILDFSGARGDSFFPLLTLNEIEDLLLPLG